jgi:hypothetical protein
VGRFRQRMQDFILPVVMGTPLSPTCETPLSPTQKTRDVVRRPETARYLTQADYTN